MKRFSVLAAALLACLAVVFAPVAHAVDPGPDTTPDSTDTTGETAGIGDTEAAAATAAAVPLRNPRFWNGTWPICIANYTGWSTWQDRLTTATTEMNRAGGWQAYVAQQGNSCGVPTHYQIRVYRFSDAADPRGCAIYSYRQAYRGYPYNYYYYTTYINVWFNSAKPACGITPSNTGKQAQQASRVLMVIAGCATFHGGAAYSVNNLDRPGSGGALVPWAQYMDRTCLDDRYGFA